MAAVPDSIIAAMVSWPGFLVRIITAPGGTGVPAEVAVAAPAPNTTKARVVPELYTRTWQLPLEPIVAEAEVVVPDMFWVAPTGLKAISCILAL